MRETITRFQTRGGVHCILKSFLKKWFFVRWSARTRTGQDRWRLKHTSAFIPREIGENRIPEYEYEYRTIYGTSAAELCVSRHGPSRLIETTRGEEVFSRRENRSNAINETLEDIKYETSGVTAKDSR